MLILKNRLKNLKNLSLYCGNLIAIPKEIGLLSKLEYLVIMGNGVTEIPLEIANLSNLKFLYLRRCSFNSENLEHLMFKLPNCHINIE